MASFLSKVMRALDRVLGDPPAAREDIEQSVVEEAIRLIQGHVDVDRRDRLTKRLRVTELSPEHRARLAAELGELLRKQPPQK